MAAWRNGVVEFLKTAMDSLRRNAHHRPTACLCGELLAFRLFHYPPSKTLPAIFHAPNVDLWV